MKATGRSWLLTIQRKTTTQDAFGAPVETWSTLAAGVYAEKTDVSDGERIAAAEVSASITARFRIIWSPTYANLNPTDRISCDGRTYDIWGVKEIGYREGFEITAVARAE